jgi:hypothetical protein
VINVEPGKTEIVGRSLVDDPGNITIRLSGTGPIAQGAGTPSFLQTLASGQLLYTAVPSIVDTTNPQNPPSQRICTSCGTSLSP